MNVWLGRIVVPLARLLAWRRRTRGQMRALWGVTPILTLPLLARATELIGFQSRTVVSQTYVITTNFDLNLRKLANGAAKLGPWAAALMDQLILAWALLRFDSFHYFHDRGLLRPARRFGIRAEELEILRAAKKQIYLFAYGADVRTRDRTLALGRWNFCTECPEPGRFCVCNDATGTANARLVSERATACLALGDMGSYVPGAKHLDYWPIDTSQIQVAPAPRIGGPLRIAHAPNHTHFKGSRHLEATIEKLRAQGREIEYVKVQGVPNPEVIALFASADIVADQFIGGAYGYTALEAMALGRPVLSYVRSPNLVLAPQECPIINVTPTTLEETLRWCLDHRDRLPAIGSQGRLYIERWHSVPAVAERLGQLYSSTTRLPERIDEAIRCQREEENARRDGIKSRSDWYHPFRIGDRSSALSRSGEEIQRPEPTYAEALAWLSEPAVARSLRIGAFVEDVEAWTSYDRSPWAHPWLTSANIAEFARFSRRTIDQMAERVSQLPAANLRHAFVGNIANISFVRASALKKHGLDVDVFLHPHDTSLMAQPFWEEFDGERSELGDDPLRAVQNAVAPDGVRFERADPNWVQSIDLNSVAVPTPTDILQAPEFMPFAPLFRALQSYDSLLVTQTFALGLLAHRPYVIGQSGGDIWFDPARGDATGRLARKALHGAYAILVSNPLTLAHARRYGTPNCLYLPLVIDETRYRPGTEPGIREDWKKRTGGDFFVLTSMRLDNVWKGAHVALEGFARFARTAANARLVILGWGVDEAASRRRLAELGIADKVLLLPIVGKARLAKYLRSADALLEQFVLGYFGGSGLEAMASGLPVVMRLERAQYEALVPGGAPPVLDASDAEQVAEQLGRLYRDDAFHRARAVATRRWFLDHHSGAAAATDYRTVLTGAAAGLSVDWSESPLYGRLSAGECYYHKKQLALAPRFPNYEI